MWHSLLTPTPHITYAEHVHALRGIGTGGAPYHTQLAGRVGRRANARLRAVRRKQ